MINPKELRIGNMLWESNSFTPGLEDFDEIVIASINDIDKVIRDDQGNGYSYDAIYPIPLTPEWLGRCGYKKEQREKIGACWVIDIMPSAKRVLVICNMTSRTLVSFVSEPNNMVMLRPVYDLHQLQNLYHALTGEELIITL